MPEHNGKNVMILYRIFLSIQIQNDFNARNTDTPINSENKGYNKT